MVPGVEIADDKVRRPVAHVWGTSFLNCVPFFRGLARTAALPNMDLGEDTPDALAQRLLVGDLDVATVPVAKYLLHRDRLLLLPGIGTGSDGPVMSCAIVSKVPIVSWKVGPSRSRRTARPAGGWPNCC